MKQLHQKDILLIHDEVKKALGHKKAVVALESAVITHGLPRPQNFQTAFSMENAVRSENATPATICLMHGKIRVGLDQDELVQLSKEDAAVKVSLRDIAGVICKKMSGGTTVAATMAAARMANIQVFATGGIGGVHLDSINDISADLPMLAKTPMIVVCSGAKSILDLPATREYLETFAVPLIGFQTEELPAFFSVKSGLRVDFRFDSPQEIAEFARTHWSLGLQSAILVAVPPPPENAIDHEIIDQAIAGALKLARKEKISGSAVTPFLLKKVNEATQEKSMAVNIDLLINNARIAGKIASSLSEMIT